MEPKYQQRKSKERHSCVNYFTDFLKFIRQLVDRVGSSTIYHHQVLEYD